MNRIQWCTYHWYRLSVAKRQELLETMLDTMGEDPVWDEIPAEALANTPDFDSLPSDLMGHLMIAVQKTGFSTKQFAATLATLTAPRRTQSA